MTYEKENKKQVLPLLLQARESKANDLFLQSGCAWRHFRHVLLFFNYLWLVAIMILEREGGGGGERDETNKQRNEKWPSAHILNISKLRGYVLGLYWYLIFN